MQFSSGAYPLNASLGYDVPNIARNLNSYKIERAPWESLFHYTYDVKSPSFTGLNLPFGEKPFHVSYDSPNDSPVLSSSNVATSSGRSVSQGSVKPQTLDYLNAELASAYGMSRSTAYQEALSNTAYQRAVKDMKSAGLNPAVLFGAGRGSAANSSIYASESTGSSRSSAYGRSSSAKGQLFSSSAYSALSAIGGLVGIALTGKPDGYWIGSQTTQGAMGLLNVASSLAQNE